MSFRLRSYGGYQNPCMTLCTICLGNTGIRVKGFRFQYTQIMPVFYSDTTLNLGDAVEVLAQRRGIRMTANL